MLKLPQKIMNIRYIKARRTENSAKLYTLAIEKVKKLHHGVMKTLRYNCHSATDWEISTPRFANR